MTTKLILTILKGTDCEALIQHLTDAGFEATHFSSIGAFFRRKSSTLLIGVPADEVETALAIIRQHCPTPPDADEHNATIFVLSAGQLTSI
ncbi:MAG: hypothetical protein GYB65_03830 [Chloroflexi bacterium]|nr:hypothetical protein [Chloroflexota bacterium]